MATQTLLIDDLDGSSEDVRTVRFALAGKAYELDLGPKNRKKLEDQLATYIAAARTPGGSTAKAPKESKGSYVSPTAGWDSEKLDAFTAWRKDKNGGVAPRGRVAPAVVAEFEASYVKG